MARRLEEIEEAREHERLLRSQAVLARERAQLSRKMHDVVSHQVSLIAVQAGATVTNTPPARSSLPLPGSRQGLIGLRERALLGLVNAELPGRRRHAAG
ncbi:hypothetical protein SCHAM137S_05113 [Streptomyces chartreusis]